MKKGHGTCIGFNKEAGMWTNGHSDSRFGAFSNFSDHASIVRILGRDQEFRTSEHAFQSLKAEFVG